MEATADATVGLAKREIALSQELRVRQIANIVTGDPAVRTITTAWLEVAGFEPVDEQVETVEFVETDNGEYEEVAV